MERPEIVDGLKLEAVSAPTTVRVSQRSGRDAAPDMGCDHQRRGDACSLEQRLLIAPTGLERSGTVLERLCDLPRRRADVDRAALHDVDAQALDGPTEAVVPFGDDSITFVARSATPLSCRPASRSPRRGSSRSGRRPSSPRSAPDRSYAGVLPSWLRSRPSSGAASTRCGPASSPGGSMLLGSSCTRATGLRLQQRDQRRLLRRVPDRRRALGDGHRRRLRGLPRPQRHPGRAATPSVCLRAHRPSPADVLRWTHEAIAAYGASTYVTMCFVFVDVDERGTRLSIALAGIREPSPWRNGTIRPVGEFGRCSGWAKLATTVEELRPGDVLMLYTDGLTDTSDAPDEAQPSRCRHAREPASRRR